MACCWVRFFQQLPEQSCCDLRSLEPIASPSRHRLHRRIGNNVRRTSTGSYADCDGARISIPARKIVVASTHGAGDEFIGALTAALWRGLSIDASLTAANAAAALLVSTPEDQR
ncbi:PfkB family carbohydrate kinase [Devosia psychrophila]|uniref:PfkB family carbohydrate kinase n=1 Tax=Devosia psychrophila TaxID=728005 RepID=UPI0009420335|nr:PfkB family carbohydrate kinase [Devosia psychrophila]